MQEYENILQEIRPFGPFQVRVFLLVSMFETPLAWAMLLPMFTADKPESICNVAANMSNVTGQGKDECQIDDMGTWSKEGNTCHFVDSFTSIVTEWGLHCENSKYVPDHITSLQMCGVLIGALVTGQLADWLGRKRVLYGEYLLLLILWLASAFAPSWQVYAVLRTLIGALIGGTKEPFHLLSESPGLLIINRYDHGRCQKYLLQCLSCIIAIFSMPRTLRQSTALSSGCLVVNFVLPLEFVTPVWRTFCGCIGFWAVGLMTLACWAFILRDWRQLTWATAAAGVPMLFSWWFVSESPRWLISHGRLKEAKTILELAAKFNHRPVPDFTQLERIAQAQEVQSKEQKKYFYWHLCSSFSLARGTVILMYGWFVSSAVYYGMNFNLKNIAGDRYINALISGLVEIPAVIFVVCVNNHLGRRLTVALLMMIAGLFSFSILILELTEKMQSLSKLVIALAMIGKFGIAGAWAATQVFSAETFPTVIRNIGVGACSMAARLGGIVAPQLSIIGKNNQAVPFAVFGVLALVCAGLTLLLPETVSIPLPDFLKRKVTLSVTDVEIPLTEGIDRSGESANIEVPFTDRKERQGDNTEEIIPHNHSPTWKQ